MRRLITTTSRIVDRAQSSPSFRLFDHPIEAVLGCSAGHKLDIIHPRLGPTIRNVVSSASRIFGTSSVFRTDP